MASTLDLYKDTTGSWRWRLLDAAAQVLATDNGSYAKQIDAFNAVKLVQDEFALLTLTPPPAFRDGLFAPTSFWNAPLPATSIIDPLSAAAVADIVAQSQRKDARGNPIYPNFNTTSYSAKINVVGNTTPRVKVRIFDTGTNPYPPYMKALHDVCMTQGVPMEPGTPLPLASDTDSAMCFWDKDADQLWEFWRFRANSDPVSLAAGVPYEARWGGRMSHVSTNPGHWVDRWATWQYRKYPDLPAPPRDADFEQYGWGATATSLPMAGGILTEQDVIDGRVDHAVGFSLIDLKSKTWRWPAQRCDGNNAAVTVCEGMRFRLPSGFVIPTTAHPIAQLYMQALRDFGGVIWDKSGAVGFRAEPAVQNYLGTTPKYKVLVGFPWDQLQLLPTGSDLNPNP